MANKRKTTTAIVAGVTALALVLGGTFAWTSISQQAKNEAIVDINPGGRLHDDFNGTNKDVYVENFGDETTGVPIYARIRLDQYMEIGQQAGDKDNATRKADPLIATGDINNTTTWETYKYGEESAFTKYWEWKLGNTEDEKIYYMPTFNLNKDSLEADINGTYEGTVEDDKVHYDDYVLYTESSTKVGTEIYDWDSDTLDEDGSAGKESDDGGVIYDETLPIDSGDVLHKDGAEHTAKELSSAATVMSMEEWKTTYNSQPGPYWVYDTDGWAYWAQAIQPGETTGLLLDSINQTRVPDDSWYYGINVVGQFATASDIYEFENPSAEAEELIKLLTGAVEQEPNEPSYYNELVLSHDGEDNDVVSGGEWLVFNAEVYDADGEYIAGTEDVTFTLTDQNGTELTQGEVVATSTSGFSSTYMIENNLFVSDDIQNSEITALTVTATYSDGATSYEKAYELTVGGNESPLSISLQYNGAQVSHLANASDPVYQIQTSSLSDDTFKFSASLEGGTANDVTWSIEQGDFAESRRGYTITESEDGNYMVAKTNDQWTVEDTGWKAVAEGTELAHIHKTTGEFDILMSQDVYPGSTTFYITATTADGQYTKTDILFISYLPVKFHLENNDAIDILERYSASFTKGQQTTVTVKPVLTVGDTSQEITADILTSLKLYYGQYYPGVTEKLVEDYNVSTDTDAGTATFTFTIPEDSSEDYLYIMGSYNHGEATVNAEDGVYTANLRIESTALVSEGISSVSIEDYSGTEGYYTPGEYTKIDLGAQAYDVNGSPVYTAVYSWKAEVNDETSENVKIKFTEGSSSAQLWILGLAEGDITITVYCSEAGSSDNEAITTYTVTPVIAADEN